MAQHLDRGEKGSDEEIGALPPLPAPTAPRKSFAERMRPLWRMPWVLAWPAALILFAIILGVVLGLKERDRGITDAITSNSALNEAVSSALSATASHHSTSTSSSPTPTASVPAITSTTMSNDSVTPQPPDAPAIVQDFPDPGLINVNDTWYAFGTKTAASSIHLQMARSSNFSSWSVIEGNDGVQADALPLLPAWVNKTQPATWSPVVVQISNNKFVMYFAAKLATNGRLHCIGYATANNVTGPYIGAPTPLICPQAAGGAIDPSDFQDPKTGRRYLVYKEDGNAIGHGGACGNTVSPIVPTWLMLQEVAANGTALVGQAQRLLNHNGIDDGGILEAPAIARTPQGNYFLFFSRGCYTTKQYNIAYATANSLTGPYTRQSDPLLQTGDYGLNGPGGAYVHQDNSHVVFHGINGGNSDTFVRSMYATRVVFNGTTVNVR